MDPRPLYVTCPHTGWPVQTGLDVDPDRFSSARVGRRVVKCPRCGQVHPWEKGDAFFLDGPDDERQLS